MVSETQVKGNWVIDPAHTSVEFAGKHMMISTVRGRFTKYDANVEFDESDPARSKIEGQIYTASVDTQDPKRDEHLRSADFLDSERFPLMTFKSKAVTPAGNKRYHLIGDLTIKDVTKEIALDVEYTGLAKTPWGTTVAGFAGEGNISRKEFGLNWNVALEAGGWLVSDTIKIYIEGELTRQQQ